MKKRIHTRKLNLETSHRNSMLNSMASNLLFHERLHITNARAKEVSRFVEKLITKAKRNLLEGVSESSKIHNIRLVRRRIHNPEILHKLFTDINVRFQNRNGGYTRIYKLAKRNSDSAEMCYVELVDKKELSTLKKERKELRKLKEKFILESSSNNKKKKNTKKTSTKEKEKDTKKIEKNQK